MAKKTIPRICEQCQASFLARACDVKNGYGKFCSRACGFRLNQLALPRVKRSCQFCGNEFSVTASRIKVGGGIFCSRRCSYASRGTRQERFWAKVDKDGPIIRPELGPCWVWTGCTGKDGYGLMGHTSAHRVSWEVHNGSIPAGLCVLHHCDNPPCVRPDHLFLGTKKDNSQDAVRKGRLSVAHSKLLTPEDVLAIRAKHADGTAINSETAQIYGVSPGYISHIVHGHVWKHLLPPRQ